MSLLETINDPADLRPLGVADLKRLAAEIREHIAETVMVRGGHFGSSTGTVELTLALHKVYDTPRDKIIWDVGHQAYAHKIVTGRREAFRTLRSYKGMSGFLKRAESIYDVFGAGHASTSISAAVGFAIARDLRGSDEKVVAVIGDGSMTGGLAFEGLNNAGVLKTDILVILNDNNMSIAGNVGALSNYLNKLLTAPLYHRVKDDIEDLVAHLGERTMVEKHFPGVAKLGHVVLQKANKLKEGVKNMVLPSLLFEELGFTYYGPVDGNDLEKLIPILEQVKALHAPILLHVISAKGKGSDWAESHPERGHAASPGLDPRTGRRILEKDVSPQPTWTQVFADALIEEAARDEKVVAITAAMPSGTGLDKFGARFPKRVFDVGIAEGHAVVAAAGMAACGNKPVVAVYSTFLQRAYDMIIHDVCIQKLPVLFALDRGGIVGDDGETHQGVFDFGYLRMIPEIVVMAPRDGWELAEMLKFGLALGRPAALRYPRGRCQPGPVGPPLELGRSETLKEGDHLAILAFGPLSLEALEAAREIEESTGRSVAVVNMRFVKPLDAERVVELARRTGRILTFEENALPTGAGSAVLEALADAGVCVPVRRIGVPDRFVDHGDTALVKRDIGLTREALVEAARDMLAAGGTR